jgi:hypothetical protein
MSIRAWDPRDRTLVYVHSGPDAYGRVLVSRSETGERYYIKLYAKDEPGR